MEHRATSVPPTEPELNFTGVWKDRNGKIWEVKVLTPAFVQHFPFIGYDEQGNLSFFSKNGISHNGDIFLEERKRGEEKFD